MSDVGGLHGAVSARPCPRSRAHPPPGTCRQGSALTCACSSGGWLRLIKRATDYDVSVPCCRAWSWSRRWLIRCVVPGSGLRVPACGRGAAFEGGVAGRDAGPYRGGRDRCVRRWAGGCGRRPGSGWCWPAASACCGDAAAGMELSLGVCSLHAEGVLHGTRVGKDGPDDASVTGRCLPSAMQQLPEFTRG